MTKVKIHICLTKGNRSNFVQKLKQRTFTKQTKQNNNEKLKQKHQGKNNDRDDSNRDRHPLLAECISSANDQELQLQLQQYFQQ